MKYQLLKRLGKGLAPPIFVLMGSLLGAGLVHAITPANTPITNTASVDYEDAATNTFTAISETATVRVGAVYAATIADDELGAAGSPGNQTTVPFALNNNGNASDTYTLTIANDNGVGTPEGDTANVGIGSDIDATVYALYHDVNGNGVQDGGDVLIASTGTSLSGTLTLAADTLGALVLVVTIPGSAVNNDQMGFLVTATSANSVVEDLTAGGAADGEGGYDAGDGATGGLDTGERDGSPLTPDGVADGDGSVQALITITGNALLDISKSGALDAANNRISYTLDVVNNGAATATDIRIIDMIPAGTTFAEMEQINLTVVGGDRFWDSTAGEYRRMTIGQDAASAPFPIGGLDFQYDSTPVADNVPNTTIVAQTITEAAGFDLNDDGVLGVDFTGLEFLRASLVPTASISIVYTVTYDPAVLGAGTDIDNTFCVLADDLDNDAGTDEVETCSNTVTFDTPTTYGVSVDDTGGDGTPDSASLTDDEDATDNDVQHEDSAAAGETVEFTNVITNNGNASDTFDLSIDSGATNTFPVGTTFSYFLGGSPLAGNTGSVGAGASISLTVKANLPSVLTDGMATVGGTATVKYDEDLNLFYIESGIDSGSVPDVNSCVDTNTDGCFNTAAGNDDIFGTADDEVFFATLTAESTTDPSGTPASDTKSESLGYIREGVADLSNSTVVQDVDVNADAPDDISDGIIDDGDGNDDKSLNQVAAGTDGGAGATDIITTTSAAPGATVTFPLFIANEQGSTSSFTISVDQTITTIPSGWNVVFQPAGGGTVFASTPVSVAEGLEYAFEAVITIPSDGALAPAGDYDFAFKAVSNSNGNITDTKVDRITVTAVCDIDPGVGGSDQVQQLGTVDYAHTITNDGNEAQTLSLSALLTEIVTGPNNDTGWDYTIRVDTDEDGDVDFDYDLLVDSVDNISFFDDSGSALAGQTIGVGGTFVLQPGDSLDFEIRVFAPSGADINDQIRVTTTISGGCEAATIIDDTTVALQVRIDKVVAVDPTCTCEENGAGVSAFLQDQTGVNTVNPGQCLIWRLTVTNEGSETAKKVVISDQITPFSVAIGSGDFTATNPSGNTTSPPASTWYQACQDENAAGTSCQLTGNITDASATGSDLVNVVGSNITFNVGTGSDNTTGGDLIGSNVAVGQFCVQVQ